MMVMGDAGKFAVAKMIKDVDDVVTFWKKSWAALLG